MTTSTEESAPKLLDAADPFAAERAAHAERFAGKTCVYRAYDEDGQIVYVGIALNWGQRWAGHAAERPDLVTRVRRLELTWCDTRAEALAAEEHLIRTLQPPFNRTHRAPRREERDDTPAPRGPYGYARFLDPEPLAPPPPTLSHRPTMSIHEAAVALGMEVKTVRNLLAEFRIEFSRAYGRNENNRRIRLLNEADLHQLRVIITRWKSAEVVRKQEACQVGN